MPPRVGPLVAFFLSSGPTLLLSVGLALAWLALWRARGRATAGATAPAQPDDVAARSGSATPVTTSVLNLALVGVLLVCVLQLPFRLYLDVGDVAAERYLAPLDRLFATVLLVMVAAVLTGSIASRRGRLALSAGLATALFAWFAWAPIWQEALARTPLPAADPTGFARPWDLLLLGGGMALTAVLFARRADAPRWLPWAPALLAAGSLLDLLAPAPVAGAPGARLAQLALGGLLIVRAVREGAVRGSAPAAGARLRRLVRSRVAGRPPRIHDRARRASRPPIGDAPAPVPLAAAPALAPTPEQRLGTVAVVHDALSELDALGAATAIVMLRRGDDLETWVQAPPGKAIRLGRLDRERFKTVSRALRDGGLTVHERGQVRDLDSLYDQLGVPHHGAIRIQPIGQPARGVLLAGRARGTWPEDARIRLARLAAQIDQRLAALERHGLDGHRLDQMLGALEAQSASLDRVMRQVDQLAARMSHLESPTAGDPSQRPTDFATPERDAHAERAFAARTAAFEQALARAPWGVVMVDTQGKVAFANAAAREVLRRDELDGRPFAELTPDPDAVAAVLDELDAPEAWAEARDGHARIRCDAGDLRLEFEGLHAPGMEAIGTLIVVAPRPEPEARDIEREPGSTARQLPNEASLRTGRTGSATTAASSSASAPATVLVPELVDALREPMKAIMTHRGVLSRRTGFADTELARHIGVVDAHLGRLDVRLTDLLTGLELATGHYQLSRSPLDAEQLLDAALLRAKAQLDEKGLRIERRIGAGLPTVRGDRRALSHVLDNLLATAIDRSAHGAVIVVGARQRGGSGRPQRPVEPAILVFTIQYRDYWHVDVAERVFAIGDGEGAAPALRIARILTEVQGGRAWGEQIGDDGRLLLNVGMPT